MSDAATGATTKSRWLEWGQHRKKFETRPETEPSKPALPHPPGTAEGSEGFAGSELGTFQKFRYSEADQAAVPALLGTIAEPTADSTDDLGAILGGHAIELWSHTAGGRLFIVADEADAKRLKERRGEVLTVEELELVVRIADPGIAAEVLRWKGAFDAVLSAVDCEKKARIGSIGETDRASR